MPSILTVKNIKFRDALMNHVEGETVYCEEENKCFIWKDKWIEAPGTINPQGHFVINYRELMINTIKDLPALNEQQLNRVRELTRDFIWKESKAHYYALICFGRDKQPYFTLFVPKKNGEDVGTAIIECLQSRGDFIYMEDVDMDTDDRITYWVREHDDQLMDYYLANYDGGVIEYA